MVWLGLKAWSDSLNGPKGGRRGEGEDRSGKEMRSREERRSSSPLIQRLIPSAPEAEAGGSLTGQLVPGQPELHREILC